MQEVIRSLPDFCCGKNKYLETLYFIRQYPDNKRLLKRIEEEAEIPPVSITGMPKSTKQSNMLENTVILKQSILENVQMVERALKKIPEEYRKGVLNHTIHGEKYASPMFDSAHENTWKKWVQRFIYEVAILRGDGPYIGLIQKYILSEERKEKNTRRENNE